MQQGLVLEVLRLKGAKWKYLHEIFLYNPVHSLLACKKINILLHLFLKACTMGPIIIRERGIYDTDE
jgi:hypothetical protein